MLARFLALIVSAFLSLALSGCVPDCAKAGNCPADTGDSSPVISGGDTAGATEVCDGVDNDGDGNIDEEVTTTFYIDNDGDGFGDPATTAAACDEPSGFVTNDGDCDDGSGVMYPGAYEVCDGIDNDCNGTVDDGAVDVWYADGDGDGYGDPDTAEEGCEAPLGYVADDGDCDDTDGTVNPVAIEVCDDIDNSCDGNIDEEVTTTYYADVDGDGYGDLAATEEGCEAPFGYVAEPGDCDDGNSAYHPGAPEADCADPNDYNCDGSVGSADADADGWAACEECDDGDRDVNPDATEVCDSANTDEDCNGLIDDVDPDVDMSTASTWYGDSDGDGYGRADTSTDACDEPSGYVADNTDCDDDTGAVNPGATEICDDIDNDCDSLTDDADPGVDLATGTTSYVDGDGDGYGSSTTYESCLPPWVVEGSGYAALSGDCDDTDSTAYPAAPEVGGDGIDQDCDGVDAAVTDNDGDGYTSDVDCDDTRDWINPGLAGNEACWSGFDADCDGAVGMADRDCSAAASGANLFVSAGKWNFESPIGSGDVSGVVKTSGTSPVSDCSTSSTDDCSVMLQGPGSWSITTDTTATTGKSVYCFFSVAASGARVPMTLDLFQGANLLASASHDAGTGWGVVTELTGGSTAPSSSGTVELTVQIASSDAVWVDALVCQQ